MKKLLTEELERMGADTAIYKQKLDEILIEEEGIFAASRSDLDQQMLVDALQKLYDMMSDADSLISSILNLGF